MAVTGTGIGRALRAAITRRSGRRPGPGPRRPGDSRVLRAADDGRPQRDDMADHVRRHAGGLAADDAPHAPADDPHGSAALPRVAAAQVGDESGVAVDVARIDPQPPAAHEVAARAQECPQRDGAQVVRPVPGQDPDDSPVAPRRRAHRQSRQSGRSPGEAGRLPESDGPAGRSLWRGLSTGGTGTAPWPNPPRPRLRRVTQPDGPVDRPPASRRGLQPTPTSTPTMPTSANRQPHGPEHQPQGRARTRPSGPPPGPLSASGILVGAAGVVQWQNISFPS